MDKNLATAVGSFVGTATCFAAIAVVSTVTKKIERAKRTKREEAHKETTQK